ncbi:MAG TPA: cytochrome c [Reyranella sp.]|jgi:cytochrome c556|nr:cytochrome c [Reyranella sp.]
MIRLVVVSAALAVGVTAVMAQSNPIGQRRDLMKGVGGATRIGTQMVKGEAPFDLAKAKEVLQTYAKAADTMHTYFPDNSKTGGETTAAPKIWESQADFRKRFDDWAADIKKASAQTKDLDSFKDAFGAVTKACGSCHETYRIKKG